MKLQKIALLLFTFVTITTFSQTEKGKFLIGVSSNLNFKFDSNKVEGNNFSRDAGTASSFTVSPEIGYAIKNNFFMGLGLSYNYSDIDDKDFGYESAINIISASPFIKLYFSEKKIRPFLNASFGFGITKDKTRFIFGTNTFNTTKRNFSTLKLGGGLSYFLNTKINIELSLNYLKFSSKREDENSTDITNQLDTNIGFNIFL